MVRSIVKQKLYDEPTKLLKDLHYKNVIDLECDSDEHKSRFCELRADIHSHNLTGFATMGATQEYASIKDQ